MDRRRRLAIAGAVALTLTSGVLAFGANLGLFGLADHREPVGQLSPVGAVVNQRNEPLPAESADSAGGRSGQEAREHGSEADDDTATGDHATLGEDREHRQGWDDDD